MAFVFVDTPYFGRGNCSSRQYARGSGSCRASASAFAFAGDRSRSDVRTCCPPDRFGKRAADEFEVVETPESFLIYFDASGFERDSVKVSVAGDNLRLTASKGNAIKVEKCWSLPENIVHDGISAKLGDNSELIVTLPKAQAEQETSFDVPIETDGRGPDSDVVPPNDGAPGPSATHSADQDIDGAWEDVADDDVLRAREKSKAAPGSSVLEDAENRPEA